MMSQTVRQRPTRKARKYHIEISFTSVFVGALLGIPSGIALATRKVSLASVCMLVVGLLIVLSEFLMEFKDRDRLTELREFVEGLEIKEEREKNDSEKSSRSS